MKQSFLQNFLGGLQYRKTKRAFEKLYDKELKHTGLSPDTIGQGRDEFVSNQIVMVSRKMEIFVDSYKLIQTTTNPQTFFGRYDDAIKMLQEMKQYAIRDGLQEGTLEQWISTMEVERDTMTCSFIDRSIAAGKTELLLDTMWAYQDKMTPNSFAYLKSQIGEIRVPQGNGDTGYIYCDVSFTPTGKTYCYRAEDESLNVGDCVLVPAGPYSKKAVGVIRQVRHYKKCDVPYPLEKTRVIIGRCDGFEKP